MLQQRQAAGRRGVDQVLAETDGAAATRRRRDAGDPAAGATPWRRLERAEGESQRARVAALRGEIQAGLDEAERDRQVRQELVEIRANQQDVGVEGTDAAYAAAFPRGGAGPRRPGAGRGRPAAAAAARGGGDRAVGVPRRLVGHAPHGAAGRSRPGGSRWRRRGWRPRPLSRPPPRRSSWPRTASPRSTALKALAAAPEAAELPAATAVLLGRTLVELGQPEAAVALLRVPPAATRATSGSTTPGRCPGQAAARGPRGGGAVLHGGPGPATRDGPQPGPPARGDGPRRRGRGGLPRPGRPAAGRRAAPGLPGAALEGDRSGRRGRPMCSSRAVAAGREAIRLKPDDAAAHCNLGNALMARGSWTRPSPNTARPSGSSPTTPRPTATSAIALADQGKLDEAIAEYREAIRLKPDDAEAHNNLGNDPERQGKLDEAIADIPRGHPAQARLRRGPLQSR